MEFSKYSNSKFITDIEVGDIFLHPFHFVPSSLGGSTNAIISITNVRELSQRFDKTDRVVDYDMWVPKEGDYATLKFIESSSIWAGSLKTKIPNTIDVVFDK